MFGLTVDRNSVLSVAKQLTEQIRSAVLQGRLCGGEKLPPTRVLAKELGVARNSVIQSYEQLLSEGYLYSITGAGTFVERLDTLGTIQHAAADRKAPSTPVYTQQNMIFFDAGNPNCDAFPRVLWAKMLRQACLFADESAFGYGAASGHPRLKKEICSYLFRVKGISCESDQIAIVAGAAGGMEALAQMFYGNEKKVAVEDPCMPFIHHAFTRHGFSIVPVEVDDRGMKIDSLMKKTDIGLIYVVPSHQFPCGGVLPADRRISLLKIAEENDAYIIEDDYDCEFRYQGEPIQSLRSLNADRVIYLGSFSKIFTPMLRIGYLILPPSLCAHMWKTLENSNMRVNTIEQLAMAELLETKQLDRHVYKMKRLYENKRKLLMGQLKQAFGDRIRITGINAGLHLLVHYDRTLDEADYDACIKNGVDVELVQNYMMQKGERGNQFVLGYGNLTDAQIEEGILRLKKALNRKQRGNFGDYT